MSSAVLVLNCGSSSIKFAAFAAAGMARLIEGQIADIGDTPRLTSTTIEGPPDGQTHAQLLGWLLPRLSGALDGYQITAVGHRVVHGGRDFRDPARLTRDVVEKLRQLTPLAPQHQPHNLAGIDAVAAKWPDVPQTASFDTAFHRTQPREAELFALPRALTDEGIIRYGFHGLSYAYIAEAMQAHLTSGQRRVVVAHLGHGASLCALKDGRSIATTMGFTALDGLMMGTRSGNIDPGVILHLLEDKGWSSKEVSDTLYKQSGLKGVSGESDDMRALLESGSPHAGEAISLFCYRVARETGSLMAALGGLDALIFTAGIGQHAAPVRAEICRRLAWTGLEVDEAANTAGATRISSKTSTVTALVIPTDEEQVIARDAANLTLGTTG